MLDHVHRAARGFTAAAVKAPVAGTRSVDAAKLGDDWRDRISADLDALADAWRDPSASTGMTAAGGLDLPGDLAGRPVTTAPDSTPCSPRCSTSARPGSTVIRAPSLRLSDRFW